MLALDRKLLRDLWAVKGQAIAIALVMGCGVAMFIMYMSNFESLRASQRAYYERYRFADVFASLKRAPRSLEEAIAAIPGVAQVETRVVVGVTLDLPGLPEPALGRLVAIPEVRRAMLDDLFLRRGRYLDPARPDEVLVHESFATARGLGPGDSVAAVINGRRRQLEIVGVALSPEYVYTVRPGEIIPDDGRYGIFWMGRKALASAFDMEGGFNDVALKLMPGASVDEVIARLDRLLSPYGGLGAIPRSLQLSSWTLDNELNQLQKVGTVIPLVFLSVAAFLLNIVMVRIITVQREQIAALKALGYSNLEVGRHYARWGFSISILGALIGIAMGAWMGSSMLHMYNKYFRFPELDYRLSIAVVLGAVAVSLGAAIFGVRGAVAKAVKLPPAEAMRPEAPASYQKTWLERIGLGRFLSPPGRIVLRNLHRQPARTTASIVGIGFAAAMLIVGMFFLDSMQKMMDVIFQVAQRQDVMVSFFEPVSERALFDLRRLPGVLQAEPTRSLAVRLRAGHRTRNVGIVGVAASPQLFRVIDGDETPVQPPLEGVMMSSKLAEVMDIHLGDVLEMDVLEGRRPKKQVVVSSLIDEFLGTSVYMENDALHRLMHESGVLSGAFLLVDPAKQEELYSRLKGIPAVAGVALKSAQIESFNKTLKENMGIMIFFNVLFAGIIAFGVVYNAARISLSERSRELASLRVLGFTRAEISSILLGELATVTLVAIPLGLVLGYGLAGLLVTTLDTELYRFPLVVSGRTFAFSAITVMIAATVSGLVVRRKLDHLDLVEVLKTRE